MPYKNIDFYKMSYEDRQISNFRRRYFFILDYTILIIKHLFIKICQLLNKHIETH